MDQQEIAKSVRDILTQKLYVDASLLIPENDSMPLTGQVFQFTGIEMMYLFFEIEQYFHIRIPEKSLLNYGFINIEKISAAVSQCI